MLSRTRMIVLVGAAAAVLAMAAVSLASGASHPMLTGVVGKDNAYKISLTSNGKVAKNLKAGTYTVVIHDDSAMHNYELDGPNGKSWTFTSVPFVGTKTVTLKLVAGKYKAYCSAHESIMFQHFSVS
jgi:hypothetical protein